MKYNYELTLEDLKKANKEYFCKYFLTFVIFSIIGFITIITLIISGVLSETILRKIKVLVIILTIFFICSIVFVFQNLKSRNKEERFYKKKYTVKCLKNYYLIFTNRKKSIIVDKTEDSEKLIKLIYAYNAQNKLKNL